MEKVTAANFPEKYDFRSHSPAPVVVLAAQGVVIVPGSEIPGPVPQDLKVGDKVRSRYSVGNSWVGTVMAIRWVWYVDTWYNETKHLAPCSYCGFLCWYTHTLKYFWEVEVRPEISKREIVIRNQRRVRRSSNFFQKVTD